MGDWREGEHAQPTGNASVRGGLLEARVHRFDAAGNVVALLDGRGSLLPPEDLLHETLLPDAAAYGLPDPEILGVVSRFGTALRADFWNPDGTRERVCGNALRCVPRLLGAERATVLTDYCEFDVYTPGAGMGALRMPERCVSAHQIMPSEWLVDPGSPHLVSFVTDLHAPELTQLGISRSSQSDRLNVTFVDARPGVLRVRTFERSVGETASCGTGALAAFVARHLADSEATRDETTVVFASGEELRVGRTAAGLLTLSGRCELRSIYGTRFAADDKAPRSIAPSVPSGPLRKAL